MAARVKKAAKAVARKRTTSKAVAAVEGSGEHTDVITRPSAKEVRSVDVQRLLRSNRKELTAAEGEALLMFMEATAEATLAAFARIYESRVWLRMLDREGKPFTRWSNFAKERLGGDGKSQSRLYQLLNASKVVRELEVQTGRNLASEVKGIRPSHLEAVDKLSTDAAKKEATRLILNRAKEQEKWEAKKAEGDEVGPRPKLPTAKEISAVDEKRTAQKAEHTADRAVAEVIDYLTGGEYEHARMVGYFTRQIDEADNAPARKDEAMSTLVNVSERIAELVAAVEEYDALSIQAAKDEAAKNAKDEGEGS